jgi:murein L,D-transpeptidase YafK
MRPAGDGPALNGGQAERPYPLGAPRASARYRTFIPVGYPTPQQRRQGLTGSAVGIHGPARQLRWLGSINTFLDWTAGCVVVGSDAEMDRIAAWVLRARPAWVEIR